MTMISSSAPSLLHTALQFSHSSLMSLHEISPAHAGYFYGVIPLRPFCFRSTGSSLLL